MLSACTPVSKTALDASNPAHCIAVFNLWATLANREGESNLQVQMIARALFEAERLETGEAIAAAKAEGLKLSRDRLVDDLDAAQKLAAECGLRQDSDPTFEARSPGLLARAQEWKPTA
jgi:hypothetical protein